MIDFAISDKFTEDPIISNDLACVLQQIDLLFDTDEYAVLGDEYFGTNYDDYLYTLGVSNEALEMQIFDDISRLSLLGLKHSVAVTIVEGTERDIALIDITLSGNFGEYNKSYVIK